MHECVFSASRQLEHGVHAIDIAKFLIDRGYHPPTVYFPLIVKEAIMIEPTETESKATMDAFIDVMIEAAELAEKDPAGTARRAPDHADLAAGRDQGRPGAERLPGVTRGAAWRLIDTGPLDGASNMAIDEALLEAFDPRRSTPVLPSLRLGPARPLPGALPGRRGGARPAPLPGARRPGGPADHRRRRHLPRRRADLLHRLLPAPPARGRRASTIPTGT